eukprot:5050091-Pyramimonas_sp.AAC.1
MALAMAMLRGCLPSGMDSGPSARTVGAISRRLQPTTAGQQRRKLVLFCKRAKCSLSIAVLCLCVGAHPPAPPILNVAE